MNPFYFIPICDEVTLLQLVINLSTIFQLVAKLATSQQPRLRQKSRQLGETFQLRPNLGRSCRLKKGSHHRTNFNAHFRPTWAEVVLEKLGQLGPTFACVLSRDISRQRVGTFYPCSEPTTSAKCVPTWDAFSEQSFLNFPTTCREVVVKKSGQVGQTFPAHFVATCDKDDQHS